MNFLIYFTQSQQNSVGSLLPTLLMFALIIVFFYFIMIRPQKKKDKEQQEMRSNLQIGDEVMTIGGIVGIIVKKTEDTVVIETGGDKSKLRIKMWAIQENITLSEKLQAERNERNKRIADAQTAAKEAKEAKRNKNKK